MITAIAAGWPILCAADGAQHLLILVQMRRQLVTFHG
jgi:hypothetical protein